MENTETWEEDEGVKTKSVDEFEQKLKDAFCDECNGVIEYNDLAKEAAEKFPNSGYDQIFKDIAREENVHKNHIKSILIDMKFTVIKMDEPETIVQNIQNLKMRIK